MKAFVFLSLFFLLPACGSEGVFTQQVPSSERTWDRFNEATLKKVEIRCDREDDVECIAREMKNISY